MVIKKRYLQGSLISLIKFIAKNTKKSHLLNFETDAIKKITGLTSQFCLNVML